MSNTKHTPGPWTAGFGVTHEIGEIFGVGINTKPDWTPVCVLSPVNSTNDVDRANARLIAAAPELLALLIELVDIEGPQPGTSAWGDKARAVIAKATGKQT